MSTERKERPMSYSLPMARARHNGLKTMTRRAINPQPVANHRGKFKFESFTDDEGIESYWQNYPLWGPVRCPYGKPGDRLWTREPWKTLSWYDGTPPRDIPRDAPIWYLADGEAPEGYGRYRHGRFMARWMSRGLDEITAVRVERLNDISEQDAKAEGARECDPVTGREVVLAGQSQRGSYVLHFRDLWESINGPGSWALNPWVWVVEFKRVTA